MTAPQVKNRRFSFVLVKSFTAQMPLLMEADVSDYREDAIVLLSGVTCTVSETI